jgi:peptidoglycan/xylan/chitin deacetylase (PgdA/CDA1 family)
MKFLLIVALFIVGLCNMVIAQKTVVNTQTGVIIELLFPQGKNKALILSYDDGRSEDRQLVQLMNKYGLKGTFHLNSNKLGTAGYLTSTEVKELFTGHEVSVHSANHPPLTRLSKLDMVYEVVEDRKALEQLVGYPVRGMAYPFGNHNDMVVDALKGLGIEYARTVDDTYAFNIPENYLKWHPTVHQFAKAFWEPKNPENDKKEMTRFYKLINDFISTKELALFDLWGHSWEMSNDKVKWDETEKTFQLLANHSDILYTTQIDLVDYLKAFHQLQFSVDKTIIFNPSAFTVYFKINDKMYSVLPGKTINR